MKATYRVTLTDGQQFLMRGDFVQAASRLEANFHSDPDSWQGSPFQVADARHSQEMAAELLAKHFAEGEDDCVTVGSWRQVVGREALEDESDW